jgi:hypothetical protein
MGVLPKQEDTTEEVTSARLSTSEKGMHRFIFCNGGGPRILFLGGPDEVSYRGASLTRKRPP